MTGNLKLIDALRVVSNSLVEGSIEYNWHKISQDNIGILAQAITRTDRVSLFEEYLKDLSVKVAKRKRTNNVPSWTEMAGEYWPMTGAPIAPIFIELHQAGMKRSDIYDLEFLNGKIAMLAEISEESREMEFKQEITRTRGFWMFKKEYTKTVTKTEDAEFYKFPDNLLKYYKAWIKHLEKPSRGGSMIINGENFPYRNSFQLAKLQKHFISLEDYKAANIVLKELEKYKK
jgi:hypothetical protein